MLSGKFPSTYTQEKDDADRDARLLERGDSLGLSEKYRAAPSQIKASVIQ